MGKTVTELELEALTKLSEQVDGFKTLVEGATQKKDFEALKAAVEELKTNIGMWDEKTISEAVDKINAANVRMAAELAEVSEKLAQEREKSTTGGVKPIVDQAAYDEMIKCIFGEDKNSKSSGRSGSITTKAPETFGRATSLVAGSEDRKSVV